MLALLRAALRSLKLDAYIVPAEDAHLSEYIGKCDARRAFISGFTGSAGCAVVCLEDARLWTDSRYYLQAEQELFPGWTLMKAGLPTTPAIDKWLATNLPQNARVGIDPSVISVNLASKYLESISLVPVTDNLIDKIWEKRPSRPNNKIFSLEIKFTGESIKSKIERIQACINNTLVLSSLDEIAWTFNLRGSDIEYNPVFYSYAIIPKDQEPILYLQSEINVPGCKVKNYSEFFADLKNFNDITIDDNTSWAIALSCNAKRVAINPVTMLKSIKNETELAGFRRCHLRDAAALCEFFGWLEFEAPQVSEVEAADKLTSIRRKNEFYQSESFATISSSGKNAAVIHYHPKIGDPNLLKVDRSSIYLLDSGAQYLDGTTDVTRTIHLGTPSAAEKRAFTRVLQGHIAIDNLVFPIGCSGQRIDAIARAPLWAEGLDFGHGVGHGVGHFLNVHEGPHSISSRASASTPLAAGMTVTNEPGYYLDGSFGIRIENVLLIVPACPGFLKFEHVTLVPIDRNLIETCLLSPSERDWLNNYHNECRSKVSPLLVPNSLGHRWLLANTRPLE